MNFSLTAAIAAGRTDLVVEACAGGAAPSATELADWLKWCAYYGDVSALRLLLARGAELTTLGPDLGLAGAAFHGHWRLCAFLLESDADANATDPATGETPLHAAFCHPDRALAGERTCVVLLGAGADPRRATRANAATDAFMRDARTRGETPLHRAAAFSTERAIAALLRASADPAATDARGETPLAWASWHARPLSVLRLLLHGAHRIHPEARSMTENLLGDPPAQS